jgi:DNA (cytosine-5)-methyltransferase 1
MADGGAQRGFNFPISKLVSALRPGEIVVDFFAGGGGASEALRQALGRDPDVAVNHDRHALGMHAANHPFTHHLPADVWEVDILSEVAGRSVGWFHASPDCTHFSQAKGGQPRDRATRSLSWVVKKIAGRLAKVGLAPRIISLENVRQILQWCPLVAKRDKATGRVVTLDEIIDPATGRKVNRVAAPGERVPVERQFLVPDKRRLGQTWRHFVRALQKLGYVVEWCILRACDYGAGTSRERLFLIARHDGESICWPDPTHGPGRAHAFVTAADCIDWSIDCPSIFTRKRPLADATCRRIAKGIHRYVLNAAEPFIVQCANASANGVASATSPLGTVTGYPKGGSHAVVTPTLIGAGAARPAGAAHALGVITANMVTLRRNCVGADVRDQVGVIAAGAEHHAVVECTLSQEDEDSALRVAAFLMRYYGEGGQWGDLREPAATVTTKDRLALVTVTIQGTPYVIVDIGLRMLKPRELYRAQGFPADYIIDRTADGTPLSISASVRMVGNSVSPPPLAAIARANLDPAVVHQAVAA